MDALTVTGNMLDFMTSQQIPPEGELTIHIDSPEPAIPISIGIGGSVRAKRVTVDGREVGLGWKNKSALFAAAMPSRHFEVWVVNTSDKPTFCGVTIVVRWAEKRK